MANATFRKVLAILSLAYGLFSVLHYAMVALWHGGFFSRPTQQERDDFQLASDSFWNLSKPWKNLSHSFITLRNGLKLHYLYNNKPGASETKDKPLVIFIHGFPDSWAIWRHILSASTIHDAGTIIAVDLPGYGGSDSLEHYGATQVLEALTEFIVTLREQYGVDSSQDTAIKSRKVIIVGHDWGATLSFRLAVEAPELADRFILSNGPLVSLWRDNILESVKSSMKMLKTFLREPWRSRHVVWNSILTLKPVICQLYFSSYIFVFHLPIPLVRYVGFGADYWFLKTIHRHAAGTAGEYTIRDAQESMASTLGPGIPEISTETERGEEYPDSVKRRAQAGNFKETTAYYRDGAGGGTWHKSLETISSLQSIWPFEERRTGSGIGVFDPTPGSLKANATIIWGKQDIALDGHLVLEGIGNYLVSGSQVIILSKSGHFTPIEVKSREALQQAIEWAMKGEKGDVGAVVSAIYPESHVAVHGRIHFLGHSSTNPASALDCLVRSLWQLASRQLIAHDGYLPGAMVLAHSLRDSNTQGKLVVLVTLDVLRPSTINELKTVYDEVIPIRRIDNSSPANLYLMGRPDLISTFSKIELWKQTQYDQIVYLDADIVAIRAPDELLTLNTTSIAAVPDIGWPDCFNTGVMVLRPNLQDYHSLLAFAQRGISFDGADQGLLNMHFRNWNRLSFVYNCTPSGNYQYVPAFRHFESTITLVHFIGSAKPWRLRRETSPKSTPYAQLLARWWAVYDRHYSSDICLNTPARFLPVSVLKSDGKPLVGVAPPQHDSQNVEQPSFALPGISLAIPDTGSNVSSTKYEIPPSSKQQLSEKYQKGIENGQDITDAARTGPVGTEDRRGVKSFDPNLMLAAGEQVSLQPPQNLPNAIERTFSVVPRYVYGEEAAKVIIHTKPPAPTSRPRTGIENKSVAKADVFNSTHPLQVLHVPSFDTSTAKPRGSGQITTPEQEGIGIPSIPRVESKKRPALLPLVEWDASRAPPPMHSKPEAASFPLQTYSMSSSMELFQPPTPYPEAPKDMYYEVPQKHGITRPPPSLFPWEDRAPRPTRVFFDDDVMSRNVPTPTLEHQPPPSTSAGEWGTPVRLNAWDEVPEIERYIRSLQRPRQPRVTVISGQTGQGRSPSSTSPNRRSSLRLTHFPTESDAPSLAVTPAPIMRRTTLSRESNPEESENLPGAEGVPNQKEWNPLERLEELQRRQSVFLEHPIELNPKEVPKRKMPGEQTSPEGST
ncbi:capsule-associated protein CAP1 [Myotisia sp. PD_48]|nr:capsule-associated protein CAP1 [Myotisia sp. PD_48]